MLACSGTANPSKRILPSPTPIPCRFGAHQNRGRSKPPAAANPELLRRLFLLVPFDSLSHISSWYFFVILTDFLDFDRMDLDTFEPFILLFLDIMEFLLL